MNKSNPTPEEVAQKLEREQEIQQTLQRNCRQLYELRCFETMNLPGGTPLAMRVPGGWIFYNVSGGGGLQLVTGEDGEDQQIVGQVSPHLVTTFVPFSTEFILGPDPAGRKS